jgi:hypothetical protein
VAYTDIPGCSKELDLSSPCYGYSILFSVPTPCLKGNWRCRMNRFTKHCAVLLDHRYLAASDVLVPNYVHRVHAVRRTHANWRVETHDERFVVLILGLRRGICIPHRFRSS